MDTERQTGEQPTTNTALQQPPQAAKGNGAAAPERLERIDLATLKDMSVSALTKDRKSTRLNSSHIQKSRMPSSA